MRYQHATDDRDKAIAEALSEFHAANVVTLRPKRKTGLDPVCVRLHPLPDMATLCENAATPRKGGMSDIEQGSPPEPGVYWSR